MNVPFVGVSSSAADFLLYTAAHHIFTKEKETKTLITKVLKTSKVDLHLNKSSWTCENNSHCDLNLVKEKKKRNIKELHKSLTSGRQDCP